MGNDWTRDTFTRRHLLKLLSATTGSILLAGCASTASPSTPTSKPAATSQPASSPAAKATAAPAALKGARVHVLRWNSFVKAEDEWFMETVKKNWAEPNGVNLVVENIAMNDMQAKISVALESGAGPDVVQLNWNWAHVYDSKLRDVSAIAEKQAKDAGGYIDLAPALCRVQSGQWKAVPFGVLGAAVFHRTDWLKEMGITKFPETWEELNRVGKLMKEKKGVTYGQAWGHSISDPNNTAYPLLWAYGGAEVDASGKKVVINSPETVTAVEFAVQWFHDSMSEEMLGWDDTGNNKAYLAEQCWATYNGVSIYLAALKDFPNVAAASDNAPYPKGPKGRFQMTFPYSHAIPAYVKDPKPAEELLLWIHDPQNFRTFMDASSAYTAPMVNGYADHPVWQKDPKMALLKDVSAYKWPGYPGPSSPASSEAMSKFIIVDMYVKAIKGEKPQDAVAWAERELKRIYEKT